MYLHFYVYAYLRKDGTPYYIGKGQGDRFKHDHIWHRPPADHSQIIFLETNLTDLGALALERRMIRWYGRKDNGTGILINKTDGGEGVAGLVHSELSKQAISCSRQGKKLSALSKEKISKANINRKHTKEAKLKMSVNQTGERNNNYGKPRDEETRRKISEGVKRRNAERKLTL